MEPRILLERQHVYDVGLGMGDLGHFQMSFNHAASSHNFLIHKKLSVGIKMLQVPLYVLFASLELAIERKPKHAQ